MIAIYLQLSSDTSATHLTENTSIYSFFFKKVFTEIDFFSVLIISGNDYVLESNMQAGYFIGH